MSVQFKDTYVNTLGVKWSPSSSASRRGITRMTLDTCCGTVLQPPQSTVYANGVLVAVLGTPIQPHPPGGIHNQAVMCTASSDVYAENIQVCRLGDSCTCGHTSTGSSDVFVN